MQISLASLVTSRSHYPLLTGNWFGRLVLLLSTARLRVLLSRLQSSILDQPPDEATFYTIQNVKWFYFTTKALTSVYP